MPDPSLSRRRPATSAAAVLLCVLLAAEARSQGYGPDVAASKMSTADGLTVNLYASEPDVRQPILVKFDDRGRLWTIQYLQYPNPAGLTRVKVDRFSRTVYDRVPEPPPKGPRGADRITICEDVDGDGRADRFKDFLDGLNLCTGLAFGHGGVYVLQAPYLLFYPDRDRDDAPDSDPEVVLSGFGMEDAQSRVNHLTWGPDGWLYGVTGSTATNVVREIEFQQAVWRVHPLSRRFELFCEGGGNLFGLTFDADGELFASSNGVDLAYHAVQGAYFRKNFGKHGPLHNPFAYGFFEHLPYDAPVAGPRPGGTIYLGAALPERFRGALLCCEFLQHSAGWWRLAPLGSTFEAKYGGPLLVAHDRWFCAPDLAEGPDGAVYICDFHDRRTAHPDPDANWDRSNGRIYRIAPPGLKPARLPDLARATGPELVDLLRRGDSWLAERAREQLATRKDRATWPALAAMARQADDPRLALQGLWGLYVGGGFDEAIATELLGHPSERVRSWTVRLLGDERRVSPETARRLADLAGSDPSVKVRVQLAATSRRLASAEGLPIVERLARRGLDRDDPYMPMMTWWAIEARARTDADRLASVFSEPSAWNVAGRREDALRLVRRFAAEGTRAGYETCARMLASAPDAYRSEAMAALEKGLAERGFAPGGMGFAGLYASVAAPAADATVRARRFEPMTAELTAAVASTWRASPTDLARTRAAMRAGVVEAAESVAAEASSPAASPSRRGELLGLLADLGGAESVPVALGLMSASQPFEVQSAALDVVARHGGDSTTPTLLDRYASATPPLKARLREVLLARRSSALAFLERVDRKEIDPAEVPVDQLRAAAIHADPVVDALVRKHWGAVKAGSPEEKLAEMRRLSNDLRAGVGDRDRGKALFGKVCATCHKLFGEGGDVGPDLTGVARGDTTALLANVVDPSAVVRAQYLQYAAAAKGGRVVVGVMVAQDAGSVTLVDAQGRRTEIPRDEIDELRELPTSIMPEDILKPLAPREVRDLFRYIQSEER